MASQHTTHIPPSSSSSHGNILIRMKRKRHAPPLESFIIETSSIENTSNQPNPKGSEKPSKTLFTRASSIDMMSPIKCEIAKVVGSESEKKMVGKDDIGIKMKKLKLGELETKAKETTSTIKIPKPMPVLADLTSPSANNIQVFDMSKDVKTETLTIKSISTPQPPTHPPVVTCNGDQMIREIIGPQVHQSADDQNYVYDLYYTEDADLSLFDDPSSILINPLDYDITWTDPIGNCEYSLYDEDYNDNGLSDDSNDECNWRNEYGEEPDSDSEVEIDRMHYCKYGTELGEYDLSGFDDSESRTNPWLSETGQYRIQHGKDTSYYDNDESLMSDDD